MKKEREPQYYTSAINELVRNYRVYYLSPIERIINILIGFLAGAALGYIFYGGLAKDIYHQPTTMTYILNVVISGLFGLISVVLFLPIRTKQLLNKRKDALKLQFRQLLNVLSTSIGSGKNITDSFITAYDDLLVLYSENDDIMKELLNIKNGLVNGISIEELLNDFGARSGIDDITSFANVFDTCYRQGGNIKEVIQSTEKILVDKMEIELDIQTTVTSSKTELNIMMVMPILLVFSMKSMSTDFADNFTTPSGILATTVSLGMFVIAYFVGKMVLNIKV